ncbi:sugar ABC transporter substrate-binding protein [Paraburkholderia sp. Ac-20336]|uniref:polysaccharide biosynthesis/export family protein n=1 Tax=Paraburkholderia sp. Ac-20336 TaxID=2703886 RepID=UPI00197D9F71|nr:polysaccharide biosynthesis/export family protein [Paraburkholderia sp. Ac-20336]MBN3804518.1 sugar ABC transporter substrate-binding protein [Paraburkholderia sp. Ac-20336]
MRFNADSATPAQTQDGTSVDVNGQHYVLRPLTVAGVNAVTAAPVRPVVDEPAEDVMQSGIGYQYKVGVGDVLHVIVWDHPELNNPGIGAQSGSAIQTGSAQTLAAQAVASSNGGDALGRVVQADGTIYYPYIGTLRVKGKTVPEIRAALTTGIARYVRAPQLDVSVVSFRSQKVYVTGEVKQPEVVPLTDVPVNVADAIGLAGGVTPEADLSGATLTRGKKQISIDLYRLLYLGDMRNNIRLVDGDIVDIPNRRIKKVFVMGEIAKPASLPMPTDGPYTLAEALNDAGGLNPLTSNARQLYLVRASGLNTTTVFHLDCSSPVAVALADQVVLSPRDIIYVDAASVTRFSRVISQMLPFAGGLADLKSLGM